MFSSHYFCHVINEAKASLILASRGNELIEELRVKEMNIEAEREGLILQKIKMKMDRIKATQQRVLEENEPKHHAAGNFDDESSVFAIAPNFFAVKFLFASFKRVSVACADTFVKIYSKSFSIFEQRKDFPQKATPQ